MQRTDNKFIKDKLYIGIDNGVTGTIGAAFNNEIMYLITPVFIQKNYPKKKGNISRILHHKLYYWIKHLIKEFQPEAIFCIIERPMVNPGRFTASISAVRALESTLIVVEKLSIPYQYVDSKEWQKVLLPVGTKSDVELKAASKDIGIRLFPQFKAEIVKHKDADGLLMMEYCRRYY